MRTKNVKRKLVFIGVIGLIVGIVLGVVLTGVLEGSAQREGIAGKATATSNIYIDKANFYGWAESVKLDQNGNPVASLLLTPSDCTSICAYYLTPALGALNFATVSVEYWTSTKQGSTAVVFTSSGTKTITLNGRTIQISLRLPSSTVRSSMSAKLG